MRKQEKVVTVAEQMKEHGGQKSLEKNEDHQQREKTGWKNPRTQGGREATEAH